MFSKIDGFPTNVELDEDGGVSARNWVLDDTKPFVAGDLIAPPVVVEAPIQVFGNAEPGQTAIQLFFSEDVGSLVSSVVGLNGVSTGPHSPVSVTYDSLTQGALMVYSNLPDDVYTLTVDSGQVSANGLALDGEIADSDWWDYQLLPSGDGQPGGDALLTFERRKFDVDGDGGVDLFDYSAFVDCVNGPAGNYQPLCDLFDSDADGDVDVIDFAAFQRAFDSD